VASFGGPTREYQVRVDPNKLIAYGLSIAQVEQQLSNNNTNGGGSFIEEGLQQINVRTVGQVKTVRDIEDTVITTKNGTALRVRDIAVVAQGPKVRLGQFGRAIHRQDGKIIDNDDVVSGIVLLRKGADSDTTLEAIHAKTQELNDHLLPPGERQIGETLEFFSVAERTACRNYGIVQVNSGQVDAEIDLIHRSNLAYNFGRHAFEAELSTDEAQ